MRNFHRVENESPSGLVSAVLLLQNESVLFHFAVEMTSRVEDGAGKYNHMQAFQHLRNLKEGFLEVVGVGKER